jgi:hypothetical protein
MGDLVLDMGRYNMFEEFNMFNMTTTNMFLQFGLRDKIMVNEIFDKIVYGLSDLMKDVAPEMITGFKENYNNRRPFDYKGLKNFIDSKENLLSRTKIQTADSLLIRDEYFNSFRLVKLGADLQNYIQNRNSMNSDEEKTLLRTMKDMGNQYLSENKRLWLLRDKPGGYNRSTMALNTLLQQINDRILLLDKSSLAQSLNRFLEKVGTAGAVLYLKSAK